jgi:hypothetical protein
LGTASVISDGDPNAISKTNGVQFISNPTRVRLFCLYKYADRTSMLSFTSWNMSDIILDDTGVISFVSPPSAKKPVGKCFQIHKGEVHNLTMKSIDDKVFQIDCTIGINAWQFQCDSKSALEALKARLELQCQ